MKSPGIAVVMAIFMAAVIASVQPAAAASSSGGVLVDAQLLTYQPVPAQPGDRLDVWIQLVNNESSPTKPGSVTILDSYPFAVESERDRMREVPSIPAQGTFLVKTGVRVDKDANEGDNLLNIRVQQSGSDATIEKSFAISIRGRTGALSVETAGTEPDAILPGGSATLTMRVKNIGDTKLRNVQVKLGLDGLALAPTDGSNAQSIDILTGGQEHVFAFTLTAYPNAVAQAYQLPVNLTYEDEQGNLATQEETIGIVVGAKPELLVYFDKTEVYKETGEGTAIIKFVNKGLSEIKLLEVEVVENSDVSVLSDSSRIYVGNIDVDDYQSVDVVLKTPKDTVEVPLRVRYKDALNQDHEEMVSLKLLRKSQNAGGSGLGWTALIVIIVVVGALFFWWRRSRRSAAVKRQGK